MWPVTWSWQTGWRDYLGRRKKLINNTTIPQHQIEAIARYILPDIIAFYESEEGQREFVEWKEKQIKGKALKVQNISDLRNVGKEEEY